MYDICNIHPSTIICLLVRHHWKTKMETHQITDFFIYFSNQTCPTFVFLVFSALFFSLRCLCFLSPGSDSSGRPPLKPQPATLQSSKAKFHPQLWQCFIDQTWPDKVGPVGVGRCQGAKVLVPYGWCGWSKHFLGGGVVSNSCFIFTSIWGRFPFWLRFFSIGPPTR